MKYEKEGGFFHKMDFQQNKKKYSVPNNFRNIYYQSIMLQDLASESVSSIMLAFFRLNLKRRLYKATQHVIVFLRLLKRL